MQKKKKNLKQTKKHMPKSGKVDTFEKWSQREWVMLFILLSPTTTTTTTNWELPRNDEGDNRVEEEPTSRSAGLFATSDTS